uniref:DUF8040 domain-containing protein n=1 Tax=Lactuca sativa TaxID=4236 RepID=A0A9R1UL03_LACSA|nr:hypothetical protein LSAT_V11C800446660 [Lactuca sativa]
MIAKYKTSRPCMRGIASNTNRFTILHRYAYGSDTMCLSKLRLNRRCFAKLCCMLETLGGLKITTYMNVDEQVSILLHMITHNLKNRVLTCHLHRSGKIISRLVTQVCHAVIRLHPSLLNKPEPITEDSTDQRWKCFKNYLRDLDGMHTNCLVSFEDKPRYRKRKMI